MKEQSKGVVAAVSVAAERGMKKRNVPFAVLKKDHGIIGDAHAGDWHRQVSLLAMESVEKMRQKGFDVHPGDFAENINVKGLDLLRIKVGQKVRIGEDILLEISQIGKECHERCRIYYQAGDCIMPREGLFAKVISGGRIRVGDEIEILENLPGGIHAGCPENDQNKHICL